ncbi:hypothetical protein JOE31_003496 [Arthrobacter sp. PvP023]|uniref:hypothetical protein n=1 Tax=Micrococcaceae TaxID=1268 RepID=UPI001AEB8710|nr:hypothetical protein [Arthrobacter sp. PvP023]MBP1137264.1 hypothetical protein [Arthrobacter sp. PvP023]
MRPLFLGVLLCFAWMAWFAGTANAASDDPDPLGTPAVTIQDVAVPVAAVPIPVAAVPFPVSDTAAAVVDVVDPVVSGTPEVVAKVADSAAPLITDIPLTDPPFVDTVSETVTATADGVVSVVDSLAPALPDIAVPTVQLPAVPVPALPGPVLLPEVPLPHVPLQLPEAAAPGRSGGTDAPPSAVRSQAAEPVRGVEAVSPAGRVHPEEVSAAPLPDRGAVSPLQFLANTQAMRALAATIGYVVSAAPAPGQDMELRFASPQNQSGSGPTGTGSAGAEAAADVAGFWNPLHDAGHCLVPDAALTLAASPSFDPGSSPD